MRVCFVGNIEQIEGQLKWTWSSAGRITEIPASHAKGLDFTPEGFLGGGVSMQSTENAQEAKDSRSRERPLGEFTIV